MRVLLPWCCAVPPCCWPCCGPVRIPSTGAPSPWLRLPWLSCGCQLRSILSCSACTWPSSCSGLLPGRRRRWLLSTPGSAGRSLGSSCTPSQRFAGCTAPGSFSVHLCQVRHPSCNLLKLQTVSRCLSACLVCQPTASNSLFQWLSSSLCLLQVVVVVVPVESCGGRSELHAR